ncbi:ABC-2 family transporter protein [Botrimarina sp.]|uniref:ABC transporter permease n=1 Tax=Botrimarina sp. TaxID=2795802 RepID=UPI0032EC4E6A
MNEAIRLYPKLLWTFARNSLIRDMTFRSNFVIEAISSVVWMVMNLAFYLLVFFQIEQNQPAGETAAIAGWAKPEFLVFIATTMIINSIMQAFFMPNAQELSELVRAGGLDFALLKPVDTQFLVSLRKSKWSALGNLFVAIALIAYALPRLAAAPSLLSWLLYPVYVVCGVSIMYSVMIALAATSIWLGRNQTLYDFWFYITNFSRYPMEIYGGNFLGDALRLTFTYLLPILVVINVPARVLAKPLSTEYAGLAVFALAATAVSLLASRWVFKKALQSYRSASS